MPNWCWTDITIQDSDEEKIKTLYHLIHDVWTSGSYIQNGFGNNWLGNIVCGSCTGTWDGQNFLDEKGCTVACRGSLDGISLHDNLILLSTSTAWEQMMRMWKLICEKYLSQDYQIWYHASEPGCELYDTNDPDFLGRFVIDTNPVGDEGFSKEEYDKLYDSYTEDADEQTVVSYLQYLLQTDEKDLQKLLCLLSKSKFADCVSVSKWDYCDVSECE